MNWRLLDLGRQTRYDSYKSLYSEPRNHGHFLVCISQLFLLNGAYCIASLPPRIHFSPFSLRAHSRVPFSYCSVIDYFLFCIVRRSGAFISFYIYSEDSFVFPQSFGTPKTEVRHLFTYYYFVYLRVT